MANIVCPYCESVCKVLTDNLAECRVCNEFFEIEDEVPPKIIKTKPSKKVEDNLLDGF